MKEGPCIGRTGGPAEAEQTKHTAWREGGEMQEHTVGRGEERTRALDAASGDCIGTALGQGKGISLD